MPPTPLTAEQSAAAASAFQLATHMPRRLFCHCQDIDALESASIWGLILAASAYDPTRGAAFSTLAWLTCRREVLAEARRPRPGPREADWRTRALRRWWHRRGEELPPDWDWLVSSLGEEDRRLLARRFVDGVGREEMAVELGVSPKTVTNRVNRALARVREWVEKENAV